MKQKARGMDITKEFSYLSRSEKTIAALSTPLARSALGIVRISGKNSVNIIEDITNKKFEDRKAKVVFLENFGKIIVTVFYSPNSYTGEDLVEVSMLGNPYLLKNFLEEVLKRGAKIALPGEFTFRAFLNGKIDLNQAEAIDNLSRAISTKRQKKYALVSEGFFSKKIKEIREKFLEILSLVEANIEFEEDGAEVDLDYLKNEIEKIIGEISSFKEKCSLQKEEKIFNVFFAGPPNAGKSTLFNLLIGYERVIVSEEAGTTRDLIRETIELDGLPLNLWDSAGIFKCKKGITKRAIEFTKEKLKNAEMILYLHDGTIPFNGVEKEIRSYVEEKGVIILTKKDLGVCKENEKFNFLKISALSGEGIEELKGLIIKKAMAFYGEEEESEFLISERQHYLFEELLYSLKRALNFLKKEFQMEIISEELKKPREIFGELAGEIKNEEILNSIFSKFCIGK